MDPVALTVFCARAAIGADGKDPIIHRMDLAAVIHRALSYFQLLTFF
jgi:hypothetical protein